jgi:hypothetical protein
MKQPGLIKQLLAGANEYLAPMGFEWNQEWREFRADRHGYFDRICTDIWSHNDRYVHLFFFRHLPEVEIFRELYGPITDGSLNGKLSATITTNPARILKKEFDLFSYGPGYVKRFYNDTDSAVLLQEFRHALSDVIFPVADQYSSLEALDEFLHHDIELLPTLGLIDFYSKKAWLLEYRWLFAKSLYIARKMNNPASKIIYDVCHEHLALYYGKGEKSNDHIYKVFEKINQSAV